MHVRLVEPVDGVAALGHQVFENILVEVPEMLLDGIDRADLDIGAADVDEQFVVVGAHIIIPMS